MSLPLKAIDRLFERLAATYGNEWTHRWSGQDEAKVKTMWAHELSVYAKHLEHIAWALENLPPRAPNVIEFKNLCRQSPRRDDVPMLPEPKADPERVKAEFAKLAHVRTATSCGHDYKAWARRLVAMDAAGDKVRPLCLRMARDALHLNLTSEA